ncbi:MAG: HAD-IB family hydrolase [Gammaproteobacteria bacterium]|nr:HAD-IB family hydrolase [Gammaproteobacteria bacterium]MCW8973792.1 HAD-IB family hydrolase [Gammaproteobacteria bacterium]MCW8991611.1 HAD-IB family hydrolase [Gammaproteobacteria bacterium]
MSSREQKTIVAAFDFDGTLTRHDTLWPFLLHVAGPWRLLWNTLPLLPTLSGYLLGWVSNSVAKERVFYRFLHGMPEQRLQALAGEFAHRRIPGMVSPAALRRLAWHRRQGHRCVVISASIEDYVAPWARQAGFDAVLATRLQRGADARLTGCYDGENCYGAEKIRRLQSLLGERAGYDLYAYGDSRGDRELLALADHAYYKRMPEESDAG